MPRFEEFRFLDDKHPDAPAPKVKFQAQKKKKHENSWKPAGNPFGARMTYQQGRLFVFGWEAAWGDCNWEDDDDKQLVVHVSVGAGERKGYVIRQDPVNPSLTVKAVNLIVGPGASQCEGTLTADLANQDPRVGDPAVDPDLQFGNWGSSPRLFIT